VHLALQLVIAVACFSAFGVVLKVAAVRGQSPTPTAAVNYVLAATISAALWLGGSGESCCVGPMLLGIVAGLCFLAGFYVNYLAVDRAGLAGAQIAVGLSMVVPIAISMLLWREQPTLPQALGGCLAIVSLVLLALAQQRRSRASAKTGSATRILTLVGLFLVQGLVMVFAKLLDELGFGGHRWAYLTALFASAGVGACVIWGKRRERVHVLGVGLGAAFGIANVVGTYMLLRLASALPATVVFPVTTVGPMLVNVLLGALAWKEELGAAGMAGVLTAIPAVIALTR